MLYVANSTASCSHILGQMHTAHEIIEDLNVTRSYFLTQVKPSKPKVCSFYSFCVVWHASSSVSCSVKRGCLGECTENGETNHLGLVSTY